MKKCLYCSSELASDIFKCINCGAATVTPVKSIPRSDNGHSSNKQPEPSEFQKKAFIGISAYLVISGIVGVIFFTVIFFAVFLPAWVRMGREHDRFDKEFEQRQREMDRNHQVIDREFQRQDMIRQIENR